MENKKELSTFLDSVSRTIIGRIVEETETSIKVENPVIVHVAPQQDAQGQVKMSLQLFPIFFREFLGDKDTPIVWEYNKANITMPQGDVVFDFRLHAQYENLFAPIPAGGVPQAAPAPQPSTDNVVKLFDD